MKRFLRPHYFAERVKILITFKVHGDERPGHRRVAGQEERPALLEAAREAVADWVDAEIGPVVAHPDHDGGLPVLGAAGLAKVDSDELDHVGFQQVDVPPGAALDVGEGAGVGVEEGGGGAVHGLLGNAALHNGALHGGLAGGNI